MQLSNDRQVNEKSFKIGMNSQNFARFDPLSWEKIALLSQRWLLARRQHFELQDKTAILGWSRFQSR
jgi:hypothetical protein